ncbi:SusC/RagA family TonB-linked outer membrane protein [Gillisia sp. Hel_I_29]|uniref:SusC/RagA family TonB-linked outer membrane protein n=1 Tax=Gillisia sp. Hel_I_29 TaxID=1249975 RepID=UPI000557924C|nr:SusC/RagA family TonB-linked outer membrane protein [Gillisia sp. Hel_I_29]
MKNTYSHLKWVALIILSGILIFLSKSAMAATTTALPLQQQKISGVVTDPNGIPILGVTVTIKNTLQGTVTNLDGEYKISAPGNAILVFSFVGFKKVEIPLEENTVINIQLEEDIAALGEVQINAGYYNTTRRESTGNISRVTAEEIELQPVVSPLQALQGRMAGVEITSGGANPGAASTIRIRGINSLRAEGNYPLYIIDGVPISAEPVETNSLLSNSGLDPLNNLNPSNIKSIEVLKDADATAIYGSRGANGVVLITTKIGAQKGTGLDIRTYTGISSVPKKLDLLRTSEYLTIRKSAFENDAVEPTQRNAYDLVLWDQKRYTDWQEYAFGGNAEVTNANLTFSGGNDKTSFRLGGSWFSQGTVYPGDYQYQKITGNMSLNHFSEDGKFKITASLNYGIDRNEITGDLKLSSLNLLPPNAPALLNPNGTLNWSEWAEAGLVNPLEGYFNSNDIGTNNLITSTSISYEMLPGFEIKSGFGYTRYDSNELWKMPARSYNPGGKPVNRSAHLSSVRKAWIIEPQLSYNTNFGKMEVNSILGATLQENNSSRQSLQGSNYASEALIGNLAAAQDILNAKSSNIQYKYAAVFARIGMNWDKKYYLNLTGRRDGSSRFGPNNRFANFGAIGTAWIFSEEDFFKNVFSFISFGKLRASYGSTGNDQIGDYGYLDAYEATRGPGGLYPTSLANPDYSWEVNKKMEVGLDVAFWKNRMNVGLSWYRNRSSNQLVGYTLPAITGFESVQANLPATVENRGLELELNSVNFNNKNFRWQTSFNISLPENELLSYPGIEQSSYANTYRVGEPLNISLNYDYTGIDSETGYYSFTDVNGDDKLDFQDRTIVEDRTREFFGGLNNNFTYRGFSLQFLWEFVKQNGKLIYYNAGRIQNILSNYSRDDFQTPTQSYQGNLAFSNAINSSRFIEDGSFFRLKTLSVSYDIPEKALKGLGIQRFNLFLHGQNLWTITSYGGMDPENSFNGNFIGNLRTITAGAQINF